MTQSRSGKVNGGNKNRIKQVWERRGLTVKKEEMKELYTVHIQARIAHKQWPHFEQNDNAFPWNLVHKSTQNLNCYLFRWTTNKHVFCGDGKWWKSWVGQIGWGRTKLESVEMVTRYWIWGNFEGTYSYTWCKVWGEERSQDSWLKQLNR